MVYQDVPHEPGGNGKEMGSISPGNLASRGKREKGFMDQGGGLEGVVTPFIPHQAVGKPMELPVDGGKQLFQGMKITLVPPAQEGSDILKCFGFHFVAPLNRTFPTRSHRPSPLLCKGGCGTIYY